MPINDKGAIDKKLEAEARLYNAWFGDKAKLKLDVRDELLQLAAWPLKTTKDGKGNDFSVTVSVLSFVSSVVTLLRERDKKRGRGETRIKTETETGEQKRNGKWTLKSKAIG